MISIEAWGQTDVGLKRDNNQDSLLIDPALKLFVVADGMGGHKGGEVASALAVQAIKDVVQRESVEATNDPREILRNGYKEASQRIFDLARNNPDLKGMGTTMVAALIKGKHVYIGNVGDSRAYLISEMGFWQLTEDHSLVAEQLRAGLIKDQDLAVFAPRNVITRSVGFESEVSCDIIEKTLTKGEAILMCSDGLSGLVDDRRISQLIRETPLPQVAGKLIDEAKAKGGDDNVTVVLLSVKT